MVKITFKVPKETFELLKETAGGARKLDGVFKQALYAGASELIAVVKDAVERLPSDNMRFIGKYGSPFSGVTRTQREGLLRSLGISKMKLNQRGEWDLRVGFDGYIRGTESKKYRNGLPAKLLAAAIKSGTTVRRKIPFIRNAVRENTDRINDIIKHEINRRVAEIWANK